MDVSIDIAAIKTTLDNIEKRKFNNMVWCFEIKIADFPFLNNNITPNQPNNYK